MKYSNKVVMYLISAGYVILIIGALFWQSDLMYILAPYALLTCFVIHYTQKRSTNFTRYWVAFDVGINGEGSFFNFMILASDSNTWVDSVRKNNIEVLKFYQYHTPYILNLDKVQTMLANLNYVVNLSDNCAQVVTRLSEDGKSIEMSASHYEQITNKYKILKNTIIDGLKQNVVHLLEPNVNQPIFSSRPKKRSSLTSFLRPQL